MEKLKQTQLKTFSGLKIRKCTYLPTKQTVKLTAKYEGKLLMLVMFILELPCPFHCAYFLCAFLFSNVQSSLSYNKITFISNPAFVVTLGTDVLFLHCIVLCVVSLQNSCLRSCISTVITIIRLFPGVSSPMYVQVICFDTGKVA